MSTMMGLFGGVVIVLWTDDELMRLETFLRLSILDPKWRHVNCIQFRSLGSCAQRATQPLMEIFC